MSDDPKPPLFNYSTLPAELAELLHGYGSQIRQSNDPTTIGELLRAVEITLLGTHSFGDWVSAEWNGMPEDGARNYMSCWRKTPNHLANRLASGTPLLLREAAEIIEYICFTGGRQYLENALSRGDLKVRPIHADGKKRKLGITYIMHLHNKGKLDRQNWQFIEENGDRIDMSVSHGEFVKMLPPMQPPTIKYGSPVVAAEISYEKGLEILAASIPAGVQKTPSSFDAPVPAASPAPVSTSASSLPAEHASPLRTPGTEQLATGAVGASIEPSGSATTRPTQGENRAAETRMLLPSRPAKAKLDAWFAIRLATHPKATEAEDMAAAIDKFGKGVRRQSIRDLRMGAAPVGGRKRGRRPQK